MGQGSAGRLASGRRWQGVLPLVSHHQGLGFRDFCRARGSQELMKKEEENCLPSPAACPGEGERRTVSLKTFNFFNLAPDFVNYSPYIYAPFPIWSLVLDFLN
jgi:hypothetical protein